MSYFRESELASIGAWVEAKGYPLAECEFFAMLRINRRFFVEYIVYGMFYKGEVIASAKEWPETVLHTMPSKAEQMGLASEECHRFGKPDRWVCARTAKRLIEEGMAEFNTETCLIHYKDWKLGVSDKASFGVFYYGPYTGPSTGKPIEWPKRD